MANKNKILVLLLIIVMIFSLGCNKEEEEIAEQTLKIPVETVAAKMDSFTKLLVLSGVTEARDEVTIYPKVMGMEEIIQLNVKEGDKVSAGQVIAILDKDQEMDDQKDMLIRQKEIQLESAEITYADAQRTYERTLTLYESGAVPKTNLEQSELALRNIEQNIAGLKVDLEHSRRNYPDDTRVRATMSGTVTNLPVKKGGSVSAQSPIAVITDLSVIEVKTNINEMQINNVKLGQELMVYIPALGGAPLTGTIKKIDPQMDAQIRSYPVTISIPNQGSKIKTGMHTEIEVVTDSIGEALIVPAQSIITREEKTTVFLVRDGIAKEVVVEIGLSNGDVTIIKKGLKPGDQVITYGNEDVVDGDQVVIPERGDN